RDYGPRPDVVTSTTTPNSTTTPTSPAGGNLANQLPQAPKETTPTNGGASSSTATAGQNGNGAAMPSTPGSGVPNASPPEETASAPLIHVRTDVLDLEISTLGGTIQQADLTNYPKVKGESTPVRLENNDSPQTAYLLQSGLIDSGTAPTHLTPMTSERTD